MLHFPRSYSQVVALFCFDHILFRFGMIRDFNDIQEPDVQMDWLSERPLQLFDISVEANRCWIGLKFTEASSPEFKLYGLNAHITLLKIDSTDEERLFETCNGWIADFRQAVDVAFDVMDEFEDGLSLTLERANPAYKRHWRIASRNIGNTSAILPMLKAMQKAVIDKLQKQASVAHMRSLIRRWHVTLYKTEVRVVTLQDNLVQMRLASVLKQKPTQLEEFSVPELADARSSDDLVP